jgi:squalene cyclase
MSVEKAVQFVRGKGDAVELARLQYVLTNAQPSPEVISQLFASQRSDGGWPSFWAEDYSSLDATCIKLAQAEQLGLGASEPAVRRAVHFLAKRQSPEGSWEEDQQVADLAPPWAQPGNLAAKLYLTANCGFWLALLGDSDNKVSKAAGYLLEHQGQDGHLSGFLHTHWLAGGLWQLLKWHETVDRLFAYLDGRVNDLASSHLSWLITTLIAAGVTPDHTLVDKAARLLEQGQQDDGRWSSEDGPAYDVHTTLETLRALRLYGRIVEL